MLELAIKRRMKIQLSILLFMIAVFAVVLLLIANKNEPKTEEPVNFPLERILDEQNRNEDRVTWCDETGECAPKG